MEKTQRVLMIQRVAFERIYNVIIQELESTEPNYAGIQGKLCLLGQKMEDISVLDKQMLDFLLDATCRDEDIDSEIMKADEIVSKYNEVKYRVDMRSVKESHHGSLIVHGESNHSSSSQTKLHLPRIEFKKFGGEIKDWIPFWSQFKRIDSDDSINAEDKFQYLIQATIPKSRARQLVESFPPSVENYDKVIGSLKSRFGKEELLVEFYVRELLKLVLNNLKVKSSIGILHDKLECQLQSLETLGVTSEKYAAMLFPLVESCLPEDLLRVWQRSQSSTESIRTNGSKNCRLRNLMDFLKKEVENEEKISLATSFEPKPKKNELLKESLMPTASNLINNQRPLRCVFCTKGHSSEDCTEVQTMNIDDKKKILSSKGCCHICLKFGHIAKRCRVKLECQRCKNRHVTLMCPKSDIPLCDTESDKSSKDKKHSIVENLSNYTYNQIFLQTLIVELRSDNCSKNVRAIIDTGSHRSYINKFTVSEMGYKQLGKESHRSYINKFTVSEMGYKQLGKESMVHALFGGAESEVINHTVYKIWLGNLNKRYACNFDVLDQPIICNNITSVKKGTWTSELEEAGIVSTDIRAGPIEVLIGADVAGKLFTGRSLRLKCGLVAIETLLGWTLMGKVTSSCLTTNESFAMMTTSMFCKSDKISDLWSLDILGISDPVHEQSRREIESAVLKHFRETVKITNEGRYEVVMPWIEDHPPLPRNFHLAERRLENLISKLRNEGYHDEYDQVFSGWLDEGIIENVPEDEVNNMSHYLPHRHVVKLNSSTTKIRPVFDASAREKGYPSLNQCLEKGMNLIELIPSILLRFRLSRIGVIADIRKAFLQISLSNSDRDVLRFLWIDRNNILTHFRHTRVVFGVNCSPFLLGAVIQHHLSQILQKCHSGESLYAESIVQTLYKSFYVDNCVTSVDSEKDLYEFMKQSIQIMNDAKFDLRCWEHTIIGEDTIDTVVSPVLGLKWDRLQDTLAICFDWFHDLNLDMITKRTILSIANKIFDPIGFSCPVSLFVKILLQKMWILRTGWDKEVSEDIKETFLNWVKELSNLVDLRIPRWISKSSEIKTESRSIHMFSDASQDAYAAVVFLRTEDVNGMSNIQLIQAKTRVSPIKKVSIPRLELLAANIGVRLLSSILETLENNIPVYCWTDSSTVLAWIQRENQWKTFVWNRIQEIQSLTKKENWNFIPGHLNPADLPSRGCTSKQLLESKWWEGPSWLLKGKSRWPNEEYAVDDSIVMKESRNVIASHLNTSEIDPSWYYRYFSNYQKILNLVGWVWRFVSNCRGKKKNLSQNLTIEEIQNAEKMVLRFIQHESFDRIKDESLSSLCPFQDEEGIIRLKTKITERRDIHDFRYPVILPSKHTVVVRMIQHCHVKNCHIGTQGLMSLLRENFWIIKSRKTIKSVVSKCVICRRYNVKNFDADPVSLPKYRVSDVAVFQVIGVDLAGPLFVQKNDKVWICIFTCAVYRAVHLELVSSLSTDSFLQAFRKFISRRGRPTVIYSDNGTNFVGAENAFAKIDWNKISEFSNAQRFTWKFSPPTGAWWGGWWERLIRILKDLLRKTLGRTSLTYDELSAMLCECEALINSRPLTYVSDDVQDLIPLTPSMFLHDLREVAVTDIDNIDAVSLNKHLRYRIRLKEELVKRFRKEYLGQLVLRSKKYSTGDIRIGDVVLIGNDFIKRMDWPLAMVVEVFPGKYDKIRVVRLKTSSGFLTRPIQRLYPLEITANDQFRDFKSELSNTKKCIPSISGKRNRKEDKEEPVEDNIVISTRSGRLVKKPDRFKISN